VNDQWKAGFEDVACDGLAHDTQANVTNSFHDFLRSTTNGFLTRISLIEKQKNNGLNYIIKKAGKTYGETGEPGD
jgi:hypothetical protein